MHSPVEPARCHAPAAFSRLERMALFMMVFLPGLAQAETTVFTLPKSVVKTESLYSNLSWAATAVSVLEYYGIKNPYARSYDQCALVRAANPNAEVPVIKAALDLCGSKTFEYSTPVWLVNYMIRHGGIASHDNLPFDQLMRSKGVEVIWYDPRTIKAEQIRSDIRSGRPLIVVSRYADKTQEYGFIHAVSVTDGKYSGVKYGYFGSVKDKSLLELSGDETGVRISGRRPGPNVTTDGTTGVLPAVQYIGRTIPVPPYSFW